MSLSGARPMRSAVTVQLRDGPLSGWLSRTTHWPLISTRSIRRSAAYMPLVLPLSASTQRLSSSRSTAWRQETRSSAMTMSQRGSRPIRYVGPAGRLQPDPSIRTASGGADSPSGNFSVSIGDQAPPFYPPPQRSHLHVRAGETDVVVETDPPVPHVLVHRAGHIAQEM